MQESNVPAITQRPPTKCVSTTLQLTGEEHNAIEQARVWLRPGVRESWNSSVLRLVAQALTEEAYGY